MAAVLAARIVYWCAGDELTVLVVCNRGLTVPLPMFVAGATESPELQVPPGGMVRKKRRGGSVPCCLCERPGEHEKSICPALQQLGGGGGEGVNSHLGR
jgi:hypothetical protein